MVIRPLRSQTRFSRDDNRSLADFDEGPAQTTWPAPSCLLCTDSCVLTPDSSSYPTVISAEPSVRWLAFSGSRPTTSTWYVRACGAPLSGSIVIVPSS